MQRAVAHHKHTAQTLRKACAPERPDAPLTDTTTTREEQENMLTAAEVRAMSDEEASAHFCATCAELYGHPTRWKRLWADEVDISTNNIHKWIAGRPPTWAILLAETKAHAHQITHTLLNLDAALSAIAELRQTL